MPEAALMVNGKIVPLEGAHLNARDRGFMLGDGLFETIRVRNRQAVRYHYHVERLRAGAAVLGLPLPWQDGTLLTMIGRTLKVGALDEAVVRLTVSRGVAQGRGLLPEPDAAPTLVIHAAPYAGYAADLYERGMRAVIASATRRNEHSPLAGVKSLNYLDNILARREAAAQGADEALVLDTAGHLAGASAANFFAIVAGRVVTPPRSCGALPGTVRRAVLDALGAQVEERAVTPSELLAADEAFLTNALMGIMPLTVVDGQTIGDGKPGARTQEIASVVG